MWQHSVHRRDCECNRSLHVQLPEHEVQKHNGRTKQCGSHYAVRRPVSTEGLKVQYHVGRQNRPYASVRVVPDQIPEQHK